MKLWAVFLIVLACEPVLAGVSESTRMGTNLAQVEYQSFDPSAAPPSAVPRPGGAMPAPHGAVQAVSVDGLPDEVNPTTWDTKKQKDVALYVGIGVLCLLLVCAVFFIRGTGGWKTETSSVGSSAVGGGLLFFGLGGDVEGFGNDLTMQLVLGGGIVVFILLWIAQHKLYSSYYTPRVRKLRRDRALKRRIEVLQQAAEETDKEQTIDDYAFPKLKALGYYVSSSPVNCDESLKKPRMVVLKCNDQSRYASICVGTDKVSGKHKGSFRDGIDRKEIDGTIKSVLMASAAIELTLLQGDGNPASVTVDHEEHYLFQLLQDLDAAVPQLKECPSEERLPKRPSYQSY